MTHDLPCPVFAYSNAQTPFVSLFLYCEEPPEMVMTWPAKSISILRGADGCSVGWELTIDPATILGGQEGDHASHIVGGRAALQRAVLGHQVLDFVRGPLGGTAGDV